EVCDTAGVRNCIKEKGVELPVCKRTGSFRINQKVTASPYVRRAGNQISAELERLVRELLERGCSKSQISRVLRMNRRVVIRVAREAEIAMQSAQEYRSAIPK